jgi:hypothetical protein
MVVLLAMQVPALLLSLLVQLLLLLLVLLQVLLLLLRLAFFYDIILRPVLLLLPPVAKHLLQIPVNTAWSHEMCTDCLDAHIKHCMPHDKKSLNQCTLTTVHAP